jgi:protein SCO1
MVWAQATSRRTTEAYSGSLEPENSTERPAELKGVNIVEKTGESIDLNLPVRNEAGEVVPLSTFFKNNEAVMLSPMYFSCPGLCNFHFNGVVDALKKIDWNPGQKFQIIAFSFDAREGSDLALKKKANYMKLYARPGTENGFHFITAEQSTIDKLTSQLGFYFRWNEAAGEWSHASAAILISPEGKITRYLHGVEFDARDLKLALNETARGKVGNLMDAAVLFCFKYDEHKSKYGLQVFRVVQLGGAAMVLLLSFWLLPFLIRSKREKV